MNLDIGLVAVGGLGVTVVFASAAIRRLPITEPLAGLGLGVLLGPVALDVVRFPDELATLHVVSEISVALALMAVALRFRWATVVSHRGPVIWMVTIGMVAMAAIVAGLAWWALGVGLGAAVLLGGILAPTDPVLSSSVVTGGPAHRGLPEKLRALLSVEAGINDGLALPLVVAGVVLVRHEGVPRFAVEGLWAVAMGIAVGWGLGWVAGEVFRRLDDDRDIEDSAFFVFTIVLAALVLGAVNLAGGDGILAVFVAGLAYNRQVGPSIYENEREVEEGINRVLMLPVFMLLGVLLPWSEWAALGAPLLLFVAGVLLLRRLPVVLVLRPLLGLSGSGAVFYGWFGPMGVAALFFVTKAHEEHATTPEVWPVVALVVAASTVVHGVTAAPGRALYERVAGDKG